MIYKPNYTFMHLVYIHYHYYMIFVIKPMSKCNDNVNYNEIIIQ